jgi:hypothetical protein
MRHEQVFPAAFMRRQSRKHENSVCERLRRVVKLQSFQRVAAASGDYPTFEPLTIRQTLGEEA